ncbi:R2-like ligand-binding oxidase [Lentibacillus sp. N15]|uniref:R2-like ligand-binding oxidase n=1 Tax=Lentibacillus songyuanensis TaxID=3136161 RepID=UPI0031BA1A88
MSIVHENFQTVEGELKWNDPMFQLYEKAKKNGKWDPADIDFSQDKIDFECMTEDEKITATPLVAAFSAGEEAVTVDILPMVQAMARQGRLEDTMFLTTFMFDEAKHTEMFSRWQNYVGIADMNLSVFHNDNYKRIFYEKLPETMERLNTDDSPEAVIRAATVYNMVVEGILAKTGYQSFREIFKKANLLPGILQGIDYLNQDEGRHLRFGIYTIQRLIAGSDKHTKVFNDFIDELWPDALGFIEFLVNLHALQKDQDWVDSKLELNTDKMKAYAKKQYEIRKQQVNKAKDMVDAAQLDDQLVSEK